LVTPLPFWELLVIRIYKKTCANNFAGFETSSNYIEEQKDGVFPKTLRNMWILVAIFNPVLSLLSLGVLPMEEILQNQASLLAWMAKRAGISQNLLRSLFTVIRWTMVELRSLHRRYTCIIR
jgi:amino acid transporter